MLRRAVVSKTRLSCSRRRDCSGKGFWGLEPGLPIYRGAGVHPVRITSCSSCWEPCRRCTCSWGCPGDPGCPTSGTRIGFGNRRDDRHWCCQCRCPMAHSRHRSRCRIDSEYQENKGILLGLINYTSNYTAMLPLLRLLGRGTWKFRPKRSARSSSSLELEFSSVRIPFDREPRPSLLSPQRKGFSYWFK